MNTQKGMTLVELMISLAISVVFSYVFFTALRSGQEHLQTADVKMTIQDSAREGLYKMIQEIRLSAPDRVTFLSGGTGLQFSVPDPADPVETDYTVKWGSAHVIRYELGGTGGRQLIRTDTTTGQTRVLANDVTSVSFTGDATPPNIVTVTLNVQKQLLNSRNVSNTPLQLSAQAELRNA